MIYTDEELAVLRENTKQIENYLRSLAPRLRETVHVEFGETVTRRGSYGMPVREKEFDLWVSSKDIFGGSGGLRYWFETPTHYSDGIIYLYKNKYNGTKFMAALCNEWPWIKRRVLDAVATQESKVAGIRNFTL